MVVVKYVVGIVAPTDWTVVTNNAPFNTGLTDSGNDSGNILAALYFREYDGVWAMPSLTLLAAADCTMRGAISYSKGAGEAWVLPVCAGAADNSAGAAGVDPAASPTTISFAAGDFFGSVCGQNGDVGTFSTHTATVAGVTFGTQNTRLGAAITTGTDLRTHSVDKPVLVGDGVGGPGRGDDPHIRRCVDGRGVRVLPAAGRDVPCPPRWSPACGALAATMSATVVQPVAAVLAAPLGALAATASATVVPRIEAALVAPLGGLSATATATRTLPATLASSCGALTADDGRDRPSRRRHRQRRPRRPARPADRHRGGHGRPSDRSHPHSARSAGSLLPPRPPDSTL